jgi:uncharacterized membrane protein YjjB (DUF3815 family)
VNDQKTVRLVIALLGLVAVLTVAGGIYLTATNHELPESLVAIGSLALGALGGLLSQTNSTPAPVAPVVYQYDGPA